MGSGELIPEGQERTGSLLSMGAMSVEDVVSQVNLIQHLMKKVMIVDVHFGKIPGCGDKPALFKAGAEKLCFMFRMDPQYEITEVRDGAHLTVGAKCTLYHITSGQRLGSGLGSCSTRESKYAYRIAGRVCPSCGKDTIKRSKFEPGWYCHSKIGGCGNKFKADDPTISQDEGGRIANEDLADQYNTVLKIAIKRSLLSAVLTATAASDAFAQDIIDEDSDHEGRGEEAPPKPTIATPQKKAQAAAPAGPSRSAVISQSQVGRLYALARGAGKSEADVHAYIGEVYGLNSTKEIESSAYESICAWAADKKTTVRGEPGSQG